VWILNCFDHSDPPGNSVYFASSFVSHSCGANAVWNEGDDGAHILRARQNIAAGDEVTISYLEEHVLLQSAQTRKRILQWSKLFECACQRCAPPRGADGPAKLGADGCRGFHCKKCKRCGVFHRLDRCKAADGLRGVACVHCGTLVDSKEAKRLLRAEANLESKINELDEQLESKSIVEVMHESHAENSLRMIRRGVSGPVGPQHWLCERLWKHLESWCRAKNKRVDHRLHTTVEIKLDMAKTFLVRRARALESAPKTFLVCSARARESVLVPEHGSPFQRMSRRSRMAT